ncbi:hypothetical protein [Roseateles sp.]|uniref:hypothetical protein n=1 Tax=Roseateles sp. TaxID=1971397 RepID=UPI0025E81E85|nr:hypothetical protein [Roseateles sp.]MBV8033797.1 hypothetical protein [Roseateles sp.]
MMRLYGRGTGLHEPATVVVRRDGATADPARAVEAIEMASRQNGGCQRYLVLDPDQLAAWKARNP